ncbi:MAG: hypothetical protein V4667_03585 [Bacteroidota bacterium]
MEISIAKRFDTIFEKKLIAEIEQFGKVMSFKEGDDVLYRNEIKLLSGFGL